ncbi:hypothetical protein T265_08147 [Opisthorchis viverrini]|uniref:Uncharacterized protein n=1 Tax=Opisthorchis viverrini TaxID=6198 RepID=A0A074ZA22_OPIVI|nr:hypothetical protein T265_08147 [Opisthorchis viverrini]KER24106.1 hypothetical protein T265_08147 [Opisthorchis viverrini]
MAVPRFELRTSDMRDPQDCKLVSLVNVSQSARPSRVGKYFSHWGMGLKVLCTSSLNANKHHCGVSTHANKLPSLANKLTTSSRRRQRGFNPSQMPNPAAGHPLHAVCPIMPAEYHTTHAYGSYAFPPVYPASHSQSYPNLVRTGHVSGTPDPIMHQMSNNNDYHLFARHPRGSGIDGNTSTFGYQSSATAYPELTQEYKDGPCPTTVVPLPSYDYAMGRLDALNGNVTVSDEDGQEREDELAREKASPPSIVNTFVRQRDGIRI